MHNDIIQVEYDKLEAIAGRFSERAENTVDMRSRIENGVQALQSGKWEGEGSAAFFTEMERDVFPVMTRLTDALEQAQSVTLQAKDILQAAEAAAAVPFKGGEITRGNGITGEGQIQNAVNIMEDQLPPEITNSPYYDKAVENIENSFWNPLDGNDFSYDSQEEYEWLLRREIALEKDRSEASGGLLGPFKRLWEDGGEFLEDIADFVQNDRYKRDLWELEPGNRRP